MDQNRRRELTIIAILVLGPTLLLAIAGAIAFSSVNAELRREETQSPPEAR